MSPQGLQVFYFHDHAILAPSFKSVSKEWIVFDNIWFVNDKRIDDSKYTKVVEISQAERIISYMIHLYIMLENINLSVVP